ncbi:GntR family transcriptional regulator [Capsulimonas corticalis]|uniref:GntR family transcriptional regulator n=1 Tax=Capsulimonas corticalis TaxID=2219043 RepID=A0A402D5Z3_9BACT|nr:GntR family transcriptional regulator [Capsulimonas corticalis]BDI32492.1 GntR family transcriptional regulator [Capsulimonas corticalis]
MPQTPRNNRLEVARVLERAILTGQYRSGDRLPEMHIARELGVSQASVREALQELEGLGLVLKYPNRGSVVTQLSGDDLVHIYQIRKELEPLAVSLAASHIRVESLRELQDCLAAMRDASDRADFASFSEADVRFHRLIWGSQPNRFLEKSLQTVCLPLFAFDLIRRHSAPQVDFTRTIRQHQLILNVLRSRNAELAARMMRRMIEQWLRQDLADYEML